MHKQLQLKRKWQTDLLKTDIIIISNKKVIDLKEDA